jgi:hypothetical protein
MANDSPAAILFDQYGNPIGNSLDQDGYYRLKVESIVDKVIPTFSVNNSTTTPLAAFGVFQGTSEDITGFVSTDVTVLSDVTSAVDGLLFEWSQDNINWNYSDGTSFTITGGVGQNYSLSPRAKYFRLSYTNGVSNQTNFALSVSHYPIDRSPVLSNLSTDVLAQRSTEVVRSILAAQKQGGAAQTNNYTNLQATTVGFLKVSVDTVVTPPVIIPTVVQAQPTAPSLGTTFFDTFDNDTAINNAIIALVIQGAGSSGVTYTFSDSQGNLYVKGASFASPGVGQIDLWYTNAIGGPLTVAATNFSTPTTVALQIYEVNGLLVGATILDKAIVGLGNSTNLSAGPILTNHDTEFCISAFVMAGTPTITPDMGWNADLSAPGFFVQSQTQALAGSITGLATASVAEPYLGILVTFLPALVSRPLVQDAAGKLVVISQITDGYYGPASVAPPLTAAMATDSALVVAISPNTPITTTAARPSTNDTFSVAASTTNTILLPSNTLRLGATIYNDASALLYVKLGVSASLSDFTVKLFPLSYYEVPFNYIGQIDAVWSLASNGGFARISELTL